METRALTTERRSQGAQIGASELRATRFWATRGESRPTELAGRTYCPGHLSFRRCVAMRDINELGGVRIQCPAAPPYPRYPYHLLHFRYLFWPSRQGRLFGIKSIAQWGRSPQTCRNRGQLPRQQPPRGPDASPVGIGNRSPRGRPERGTACRPGRSLAPGHLSHQGPWAGVEFPLAPMETSRSRSRKLSHWAGIKQSRAYQTVPALFT